MMLLSLQVVINMLWERSFRCLPTTRRLASDMTSEDRGVKYECKH